MEEKKGNILVAPLNWGLGHATRCIPIINGLITNGFNPIIASDGIALSLLKKEFPDLLHLELPSYNITYPKNKRFFRLHFLLKLPTIISATNSENKLLKKWIVTHNLKGVISDNRFGLHNKKIPCIYITHQLRVLSGKTTIITTKIHQGLIRKFNECWVPDVEILNNLSGKLGHINKELIPTKYIGALSRFKKEVVPVLYDLLVILSGPEPQRTVLEQKLRVELKLYKGSVLFVKGIVADAQLSETVGHITFYDFMTTLELEKAINSCNHVLCRSGYTSVMDLAVLQKKVFFIPTPGQYEQEYLAKKLHLDMLAPYCVQDDFTIEKLKVLDFYKGLSVSNSTPDWNDLFNLFEGKRKLGTYA